MKALYAGLVIVATILAAGCSGGGGDGRAADGNVAPQINSLRAGSDRVWLSERTSITCEATDEDGDALTYEWTCGAGVIEGSGATVGWRAPETAGTCTVTVRVSDDHDASETRSVQVSYANASVEGRVIDAADDQGEANVVVTIDGQSATSGAAGLFTVPDIGPGEHSITVTPPQTYTIISAQESVSVAEPGSVVALDDPIAVLDTGVGPPPDIPALE